MATNNAANNATAATGTVLQGQGVGTASAYSTATYPATATSTGTILRADGTNWSATTATYPNTTTLNQILYSSSANTVAGITAANSGVLATSSSGVPAIDTTNFAVLSTGLQLKGNNTNTAPPSGFIGERIVSTTTLASGAITLSNNSPQTIVSITLSAGIWDLSFAAAFNGTITGTATAAGIATATNSTTGWVDGDTDIGVPSVATSVTNLTLTLAGARLLVSTSTTYFLTALAQFSAGTYKAFGRFSAVRVG